MRLQLLQEIHRGKLVERKVMDFLGRNGGGFDPEQLARSPSLEIYGIKNNDVLRPPLFAEQIVEQVAA